MVMTANDLAKAIAAALDSERDAAGWTLKALGDELGISEQTMGRYFTRRERDVPVRVLVNACRVIGVPLTDVIATAQRRLDNPPLSPAERGHAG